ncbi:hypothetical protein QJS04_geneDACA005159 [Acorus gramineus]|uniref:Uncharacterized protein n=1 Tax=Acorus gramineus TaxID=55184 RepID=A0AAV9AVJ0_ACOGR|nr:hypothetical protein QJS04_geneDACA005159 [Acorus gramineus]
MGGEDRNKMMQNLFGEQSEEEEEEEGDEVESGYEGSSARRRPHYHSSSLLRYFLYFLSNIIDPIGLFDREEGSDDVAESEEKGPENEEEDYGQRVVTGRSSLSNKKDHLEHSPSEKPVLRDVLGDSDEDEAGEYGARNELEQDSHAPSA